MTFPTFRLPRFDFSYWDLGFTTGVLKEVVFYAVVVLIIFQWFTRDKDNVIDRGKSHFWGSLEKEGIPELVIHRWLDPLLAITMALFFYFIDLPLFFFFLIGGVALWVEESGVVWRHKRAVRNEKIVLAEQKKRYGGGPSQVQKGKKGDIPVVTFVSKEEQERFLRSK